ncbi:hypothetical protein ACFRAQ_28795 [Nocardia sp. NPDC056611]|uniref:hypothetical protein n=1 Tax=Nocardia sp. NPDC056611 TaxID=3345877 RepID=UPI0036709FFF
MKRLKRRRPRCRLDLHGHLDQERLEQIRAKLGLTKMGRLSDWQDEDFGWRDISHDGDSSLMLNLWRHSEDQWSILISAADDIDLSDQEIARWRTIFTTAVLDSGLEITDFKVTAPPHRESYETTWWNENWLRTTHWDLPAQNLEELWPVIGVHPSAAEVEKRDKLAIFMTSPTWQPAPVELREQAENFIRRVTEAEHVIQQAREDRTEHSGSE